MSVTANGDRTGVLEEYARLKLDLAGTVRVLLRLAEQRHDEMAVQNCRHILERLVEDQFNLAVVGQFNRGKSSLMNALLGVEKLPTGILPLTSVITTVAYGETERVLLQREGWTFPQEIRLDELASYVTQRGNPGNEKRVTFAEIQLPHELLRLGVHFIDTPGIASAIRANTLTTRQFVPEIDAAILVTSFESPLAETELDFLRELRESVRKVFIVVNKHDLVPPAERMPVAGSIREELEAAFGERVDVFTVSARDALHAAQRGSRQELEESGLPTLASALTDFLRTQKAQELLLRAADRAESLARQQATSIRISERSRTPAQAQKLERRLQQVVAKIDDERRAFIRRLRGRLVLEFAEQCRKRCGLGASDAVFIFASGWQGWFHGGVAAGDNCEAFLQDLAQRLFSEWTSRNRQEIDAVLSELMQPETKTLDDLVSKIARVPAELLGEEPPADGFAAAAGARPLTFRPLSMRLGQFQTPWWYDLLPATWSKAFLFRRWRKRVPEFIDLYEESARDTLRTAIEDWIAGIDRQLERQIEETSSRLARLLHGESGVPGSSEIENILDRIRTFKAAVWRMNGPHGLESPLLSQAANCEDRRSLLERCQICSHLERTLWDFFARFQYELATSENRQREHALRSGFCSLHTWQYETVSSPQGTCAGYPEVLTRVAARLRGVVQGHGSVESMDQQLRDLLPGPSSCEACELLAAAERAASERLARQISDPDCGRPCLCAYHLHTVLAAKPDAEAARKLVLDQARVFDDLAREMQNYVLKHTAIRHHLETRSEGQAAVAGLSRLAGSQRIVVPCKNE
jgi:GTP-binding protein EngB required for normal cell division